MKTMFNHCKCILKKKIIFGSRIIKSIGFNKIILFNYIIKNTNNNEINLKRKENDNDDMHKKNACKKKNSIKKTIKY